MTPSYQAEMRKLHQQEEYDRKLRDKPVAQFQIPPEDYDFWHTTVEEQEGDDREVKFDDIARNKGLWIVTMEETAVNAGSYQTSAVVGKAVGPKKNPGLAAVARKEASFDPSFSSNPSKVAQASLQATHSPRKQTQKEPPKYKDSFEAQRAKHQAVLGERMPVGRDGRRLPLPVVKPQPRRTGPSNSSSDSIRRSGPLKGAGETMLSSSKNLR
jgi:hypothetical protein